MPLASDGKGNFLTLGQDGQWAPATRARNPETGAELVLDGTEWKPLPQQAPTTPERGIGETAARLVGNFGAEANDRIAGVLGAPFDLVNRGMRAVGVPIPEGSVSDSIRSGINAVVGQPPVAENTAERFARGAGGGVVDAATVLVPALGVSRAAQAGSLTQRVGTAAAASPGLQVASGVAGGAVGEATDSPLLGAAAALAAPFGAALGSRAITPVTNALSPARAALVQTARREGIPLTAGQETGSRFLQNLESRMRQLPQTAPQMRELDQARDAAFNRAVNLRAGENADNMGPDVLQAMRQRLGGTFNDLTARNNLDASPPQFIADLAQHETDLMRFADPAVERHVINRMRDILSRVDDNDQIPGPAYRQLDSAIGRAMEGTANRDLATSLNGLRQTFRGAMDNSITPEDQAAWQEARRHYANYMVIRNAMRGAGGGVAEGNISPLALRTQLGDRYAMGEADLEPLARVGQSLLRAPPDSGTAGHMAANALLTGTGNLGNTGMGALIGQAVGSPVAGAMAGAAYSSIAPRAVQSAMLNPMMQAYLRNQAVNPQTQQAIRGFRNNVLMQQGTRAVTD